MLSKDNQQRPVKLEQLQFLRFIAFFFIFSLHAGWLRDFYNLPNLAMCSVSFFFILSGFVSGYNSYNKDIVLSWDNWKSGILKRLKKIYPLYAICVLVSFYYYGKISQAVIYSNYGEINSLLLQLVKCLLMIQSWFPNEYFNVYAVCWFISSIMFLYVVNLPILYVAKKILKEKGHKYILGIAVAVFAMTFAYCYKTKDLNVEFWHYVFPIARLGEFILGICLGLFYSPIAKHFANTSSFKTKFFTFAEVASLVACFIFANRVPLLPLGERILFWILPNLAIITIFMLGQGYLSRLFSTKQFIILGNASLELYLIHYLFIQGYTVFNSASDISIYGNIVNFAMCFGLTVMIGLFIHKQAK